MPQIIQTNIASLNAQRNLNNSQSDLGISLQRLSSGLRINSAKDDAAGLAISERFTTQIRGLNQAGRNANDGVSLAQTAEGDLAQITNNLQRVRELAVQSANATNSASDRAALQLEVTQLVAEIDRVASTSAFNGVKLLDGAFASQSFQVGANSGETVDIASITSARAAEIGQRNTATATGTAVAGALTAGELTIAVDGGTAVDVGVVARDAAALATAITTAGGDGVTATATNAQTGIVFADVVGTAGATVVASSIALGALTEGIDTDTTNSYTVTFDDAGDQGNDSALVITATANVDTTATNSYDTIAAGFVTAGFASDGTGTVDGYSLDLGAQSTIAAALQNGTLTVQRADGSEFSTVEGGAGYGTDPAFANTATTTNGTVAVTAVAPTYNLSIDGTALDFSVAGADGTITDTEVAALINSISGYTATAGTATLNITKDDGSNIVLVESGSDSDASEGLAADGSSSAATETYYGSVTVTSTAGDLTIAGTNSADAGLTTQTYTAALAGTTVADTDISTVAGANAALITADAALTSISNTRSSLGAIQNRFESIVSSISTSVENLSAARSRIRDADFAAETASLTRNQILQQAGVSILSQANALPQLALSLLQ